MLVASLSLFFFYLCFALIISSFPAVIATRNELALLSFEDGYTQIFGDDNLMLVGDGKSVQISLDRRTGAGFASQDLYLYGFFSASIKLPSDYAAGVVVAFYMSNGDVFEKTHDELDFEFLGNIRGREWRVQTNVYGNGSTSTGREERYELWFDPTEDFHHYSILWSSDLIMFFIDDIPIREIPRTKSSGGDFPSKPMSLYATIWDGSSWATSGGRYKVNYRYAPYIAEFTNLILHGCAVDPFEHSSSTCSESDGRLYKNFALSPEQRLSMERFRNQLMVYSYCYDRERYLKPPPECELNLSGRKKFGGSGSLKFGGHHGRSGKHHRRTPTGTWVRAESQ